MSNAIHTQPSKIESENRNPGQGAEAVFVETLPPCTGDPLLKSHAKTNQVQGDMNIPQKTNPPALDRETVIPELVTHSTSLLDPKEYRDEYADQMLNYFMNHKKYHTIYDTHYFADGHSEEKARQVPNPPPSFREFAASLFVTTHRLKSWGKKNPRFREALEECGEIVKEFIIENGITGKYSSQFAIFVAKNVTDMKDKTEVTKKTVTVHKLLNAIEAAPTPAALKAADTEGLYEAEI